MLIKKNTIKFCSQDGRDYITELVAVRFSDEEELQKCANKMLHENELYHYRKIKEMYRKQNFFLGRIAAKFALEMMIPEKSSTIDINNGIFSQPLVYINNCNMKKISISHSDDTGIALAYSEKLKLGIDYEVVKTGKIDIYNVLKWCAKEALAKALEIGLYDYKIFEIMEICKMNNYYLIRFKYFHQFQCIGFLCDSQVFTIAYPKSLVINDCIHINKVFNNWC